MVETSPQIGHRTFGVMAVRTRSERPVGVGLVSFGGRAADAFPAKDLGLAVRWQVAPSEMDNAVGRAAVDRVVIWVQLDEAEAAATSVQRIRRTHPDIPLWLALSAGPLLLLTQIVSVVARTIDSAAAVVSTEMLTVREIQILKMIRSGLTNRDISRKLEISLSTVNRHVEHILLKLGVRNRTQAAVLLDATGATPRRQPFEH
jgi:DNA-binding CsgD family transcriptional regulator